MTETSSQGGCRGEVKAGSAMDWVEAVTLPRNETEGQVMEKEGQVLGAPGGRNVGNPLC